MSLLCWLGYLAATLAMTVVCAAEVLATAMLSACSMTGNASVDLEHCKDPTHLTRQSDL